MGKNNNKFLIMRIYNDKIIVFMYGKVFLKQDLLISCSKHLSNKTYTFLYVCKILSNFGLIGPLNKSFGY